MTNYTRFFLLILALLFATGFQSAMAQESNVNSSYDQDTSSLDHILSALYEVISGEAGEERNWDRFLNLFYENAWLIPSGQNQEGIVSATHMSPKQYVEQANTHLVENGFFEKELSRKEQRFGNITHVWSTYESFRTKNDIEPFSRGINSIQLLNDGNRWWILNIYWTPETLENPIPQEYLSK